MSEVRNRLGDETSPYLRQHADNPVAWYPWGDEALRRARREDRPIFLSVGYSACHWCHVMERESFEDQEIAERLNEAFVNIKVDREERPDLDRIYMDAVQLMTGQGGWPMSVWLTPDLEPFYAGTYFPPKSKWGRPGFVDVVEEVRRVWSEERDRVEDIADEMAARLHKMAQPGPSSTSIDRGPIRSGADALSRRFDPSNGGFGTKPKFPAAGQCRLLFRVATDDDFSNDERQRARDMAETTLVHMASGGMYDHLGGGFHRYSTDARWLVPHFEKMLYDNALLLNTYREGWELTGRPYFRRIVEETGQYVLREMVDSADSTGAFFSTQDADTEGREGKFFVWTPEQLCDVLGPERGRKAAEYWGVSDDGNFEEGHSVLHRLHAIDVDAGVFPEAELDEEMEAMRRELFDARQQRVEPGRDEKIIASWNGLMIEALARAGAMLGNDEWIDVAEGAANFVFDEMCQQGRGRGLRRVYNGGRSRFDGCLDDYANMGLAAIALYEVTGRPAWLADAREIAGEMNRRFGRDAGGFYYSAPDRSDLIVRQSELQDSAMPSATSRAFEVLERLATWTGDSDYREQLDDGLCAHYSEMSKQAGAMTNMIRVLDSHLAGSVEIVVARGEVGDDADGVEDVVRSSYLRHAVSTVYCGDGEQPPVVEGKSAVDGNAAVYICERGRCQRPETSSDALRASIREMIGGIDDLG